MAGDQIKVEWRFEFVWALFAIVPTIVIQWKHDPSFAIMFGPILVGMSFTR